MLTYGLDEMEIDVVDGAKVTRQLVHDPPGQRVPDVDEAVRGPGGHHGAVRAPPAVQEVLLEVVLVAGDDLEAALGGREGPDVPHAQRVVHGVGEHAGAVRRERDAGDGVGVAGQAVQGRGGVAQVPDLDLVVDASADDL